MILATAPAVLLGRRGCPLTQRNSLALPVSGPDWELRGGIGAGGAHPLGTPQARGRSVRRGRARVGRGWRGL